MDSAGTNLTVQRRRGCDICQSEEQQVLHEQKFVSFDHDAGLLTGYDVTQCHRCGFIYADGLPDPPVFDRYYREMSKHEPDWDASRPIPAYKRHNIELIVAECEKYTPDRSARILDVGVGTGDILLALRSRGYEDLTGLDPSARTSEMLHRIHGLRILNIPVSELHSCKERFDVILLSGVLEHLRDLRATLMLLKTLLREGGRMCIAVPDASRFLDFVVSPFQYFSTEHINFFTKKSLETLLSSVGMALQGDCREATALLGVLNEPIVQAIFREAAGTPPAAPDVRGADQIKRYVAACREQQDLLMHGVEEIANSAERIIVWGVGSLTMHLLSDRRFARLNIIAFVDGNGNYWDKTIRGIPVVPPARLAGFEETILIVSYSYEAEINQDIRQRYLLDNKVVRLFEAQRNNRVLG